VQTKVSDKRFFAGLPIPAAAGTVTAVLFFDPERDWRTWMAVFLLVLMGFVAFLMVSTFRYRSFKQVDLGRRRSYRAVLLPALILLLVAWKPQIVLATIAIAYAISGPLEWLIGRLRGSRGAGEQPAPVGEPGGGGPDGL
jgi:CDP-diacylglycerol--serine O-phosphatidyltransferase